jgi:hypothetical protein
MEKARVRAKGYAQALDKMVNCLAAQPEQSERVAAVRDVVLASSAEASFSAAEVAARLERAKQTDVADILESFVALGYLVAFESPDGTRRWARPARAA